MTALTVLNGDFETIPAFTAATNTVGRWIDGTAGGSTTTDTYKWYISNLGATSTIQFDEAVVFRGAGSIKMTKSGSAGAIFITSVPDTNLAAVTVINQTSYGIAIEPSTTYVVSWWVKQTLSAGNSKVYINQFDGTNEARLSFAAIGTDTTTSLDWTLKAVSFTSHASAAYLILQIGCESVTDGTLNFDNIQVEKTFVKKLRGALLPAQKSILGLERSNIKSINGLT